MRQAERRTIGCRLGNHVSEIPHLAHEGKLRFLAQRRKVHVGADRTLGKLAKRDIARFSCRKIAFASSLA